MCNTLWAGYGLASITLAWLIYEDQHTSLYIPTVTCGQDKKFITSTPVLSGNFVELSVGNFDSKSSMIWWDKAWRISSTSSGVFSVDWRWILSVFFTDKLSIFSSSEIAVFSIKSISVFSFETLGQGNKPFPFSHRHLSKIDCLKAHTPSLVYFISTVNGHRKKRKRSLERPALSSGHITNLKQSILDFWYLCFRHCCYRRIS